MIKVPREWTPLIWYGLTAIGILVGISTFFLFGSRSDSRATTKQVSSDTQKRQESTSEGSEYRADNRARMYEAQRKQQESERERQEHQAEYQARLHEIQRKHAETRAIKDDLYSLFGMSDGQSQKRERLLEGILNRLFEANDIPVREAFKSAGQEGEGTAEHIEGVIEINGRSYLVEMKWWNKPVGSQHVAPHLVRVFNRGYSGGVLVSSSNFTQSAITICREALPHRAAMLCELEEIVSLLERSGNLKDFLEAKIAAAVVDKNPLFRPLG
jgi:hypothetical protein